MTSLPVPKNVASQDVAIGRHAQALPSFVRRYIKAGLKSSVGPVEADQFFSWTQGPCPDEQTCIELRKAFLSRVRINRKEIELRDQPINVQLSEDWPDAVFSGYVKRTIGKVVDEVGHEHFHQLTLRGFKERVKLTTEACLGLLAKLEGANWSKRVASAQDGRDSGCADPIPVLSDAERSDVQRLLVSPWIVALNKDDLRFPAISGISAGERLATLDSDGVISRETYQLFLRLRHASDCSWSEELLDVALHLAETFKSSSGADRAFRAKVFHTRYGGNAGRTLMETGALCGISHHQTVHQYCKLLISRLRTTQVQMPALDRLFAAAAPLCPISPEEANRRLSGLLGDGFGIEAAMSFAKEFMRAPTLSCEDATVKTEAGYQTIRLIVSVLADAWIQFALSCATRECGAIGCTSFLRIAGFLALKNSFAVTLTDLTAVMAAAPGYYLLDAESGWFTLDSGGTSATAQRIRKLMSVATAQVEIDEIATSLITVESWLSRDSRQSLAIAPTHVLVELLKSWPWLKHNQHNKFWLTEAVEPSTVLSGGEAVMLAALDSFNGVASRQEITAYACMPENGLGEMIVNKWLAGSPIFVRYQAGIYGVRGRPLNADAINEAIKRKDSNLDVIGSPRVAASITRELSNSAELVRALVYQAHPFRETGNLRMRTVALRKSISDQLGGVEYFEHIGNEFDRIRIWQGALVYGVAEAAESLGVRAGEPFNLVFYVVNKMFDINVEVASDL